MRPACNLHVLLDRSNCSLYTNMIVLNVRPVKHIWNRAVVLW